MKAVSDELSRKLTVLSFVGAGLVVLLHAYDTQLRNPDAVLWIEMFLSRGVATIAVPLFFVVSGYLAAFDFRPGSGWYGKLVKKRFFSLVIPYLWWCTLYAVTLLPFTMLGNSMAGRPLVHNTCLAGEPLSVANVFRIYGADLFDLPVAGQLWYIRNLVILILLSPVIFFIMKRRMVGVAFCILLAIGNLFAQLIAHPYWKLFETGFCIRGILFFAVGCHLALFAPKYAWGRAADAGLAALWLLLLTMQTGVLIGMIPAFPLSFALPQLSIYVGLIVVWRTYDCFRGIGRLADYSFVKMSFFIYAFHYGFYKIVFCDKVRSLFLKLTGDRYFLFYLTGFAVTLGSCIATGLLLRRYLPRVYGALCGNRGR